MEELIIALAVFQKYMKDDYHRNFPTHCDHGVMYVCGVDIERMDSNTAKELISYGFCPESYDIEYDWEEFTQEEWEMRVPNLTGRFYSYKYGSC
jgi:hypothetical protein